MTSREDLEKSYRRLLAWYPRVYWREHEEEMLAVLLAGADDVQRRPPEEAAQLLTRLAARPGLEPGDAAAAEITRLCGYLPLAVGMLARQLHHHPAWTAARLASDLAAARDRLELMHAEDLSVAAAFDLSYHDLTADQQSLFRRLGLHPGTDIDAYAVAALADISLGTARRCLDALYDQHLLTEPAQSCYGLHDLIREHARARAAADPAAERQAAIGRLLDYYLHTARAASHHLTRRPPAGPTLTTGAPPVHSPDLSAREDAVSWMNAERLNLHAAAGYAAIHNLPRYTIAIAAVMHSFLRVQSHWDRALTLHRAALSAARDTSDKLAEAGALTDLGDTQYLILAYPDVIDTLTRAPELYRDLSDRLGEASVLSTLGMVQQMTGDYPAAAASQERSMDLYRVLGHRLGEATALNRLGGVRLATGDYPVAEACQEQALALYRDAGDRLGEASVLARLGSVLQATGDYAAAAASLSRALALSQELGGRLGEGSALNGLGEVQLAAGDYQTAAASFARALALFRDLGSRLGEASALNSLGSLQHKTGNYPAAAESLSRALTLNQDLGRPREQAQVLNNMGDLSLTSATPAQAHARYGQALAIATSIGTPSEEARALEGIGRCHLHDGRHDDGSASLRQALAIFRRIGSPSAKRVHKTLTDHETSPLADHGK